MPSDIAILECTEARAAGFPPSRYTTRRNKKSPNTPNRLEKIKFNKFMRKHTLHREVR
jgi:large subunit ribosomal protein L33